MTFEEKIAALHQDDWINLGDDHYLAPDLIDGELWGYTIWHRLPNDEACAGYINVRPGATNRDGSLRPLWTIDQADPLTVSPSVLMTGEFSDHGWIRDGKWVPA